MRVSLLVLLACAGVLALSLVMGADGAESGAVSSASSSLQQLRARVFAGMEQKPSKPTKSNKPVELPGKKSTDKDAKSGTAKKGRGWKGKGDDDNDGKKDKKDIAKDLGKKGEGAVASASAGLSGGVGAKAKASASVGISEPRVKGLFGPKLSAAEKKAQEDAKTKAYQEKELARIRGKAAADANDRECQSRWKTAASCKLAAADARAKGDHKAAAFAEKEAARLAKKDEERDWQYQKKIAAAEAYDAANGVKPSATQSVKQTAKKPNTWSPVKPLAASSASVSEPRVKALLGDEADAVDEEPRVQHPGGGAFYPGHTHKKPVKPKPAPKKPSKPAAKPRKMAAPNSWAPVQPINQAE